MRLAGFFVEYLIIGSVSLFWFLPLLQAVGISIPETKSILVLIAPAIYVLGMMVDVSGHYITKKHRKRIREAAKKRYCKEYELDEGEWRSTDIKLMTFSSEIAKSAIARNSRARVARGSLINALIGLPLCIFIFRNNLDVGEMGIALILSMLTIGGLWKAWKRWQRLSFRFEIKSLAFMARNPK